MDALAEVLSASRTGPTKLTSVVAHAPWGLGAPACAGTSFHVPEAGTCWLRMAGQPPRALNAGDVVLLPRHRDHSLASSPTAPATPLPPQREVRSGVPRTGAASRFFCGAYDHDREIAHPLVELLPAVLVVGAAEDGIADVVHRLRAEVARGDAGSALAVDRLVDLLSIYVIRRWLAEQADPALERLAAIRDRDVAKVLGLLHAQPQLGWTVESLARASGMSRATLARRFSRAVGEPPHAYLTRCRLELAARRLRGTDDPIAAIARYAGYASEHSFSRAFARHAGRPPGRYRAEHARHDR